jgi:CubicO group peptidase (beta-lactamase class C family)
MVLFLLWLSANSVIAAQRLPHKCQSLNADNYSKNKSSSQITQLFHRAILDHAFPGGCVVAGTKNRVVFQRCYGNHSYGIDYPDRLDDVFDLASLTKVIGTTTALLQLQEQHRLKLSDKVVRYLPEFSGPNRTHQQLKKTITIEDLLRHRSGLPEINCVDRMSNASQSARWNCLYQTPLINYPRQKVLYSDVNFLLLGKIAERVSGESLDCYLENHVFRPLEMHHSSFHPQEKFCKIVPTYSSDHVGIVHDPVARSLGGVCGHAGLFSTAIDLQHFAQMILNGGVYHGKRILQEKTLKLLAQPDPILADSTRFLGWDSAYRVSSPGVPRQFSAGLYCDSGAIGHTGYTGTSLWISQKQGVYLILLTNRVFKSETPSQRSRDRYWRQQIVSTVWKSMGFTKQNPLYHEPRQR